MIPNASESLSVSRERGEDDLLTIAEVAVRLRVCKPQVMRHVHGNASPALAAVRLGRRYLIRRATLDNFIRSAESVESAA